MATLASLREASLNQRNWQGVNRVCGSPLSLLGCEYSGLQDINAIRDCQSAGAGQSQPRQSMVLTAR